MDDSQKNAEYLKLVQGIIARMAGNSVQMKTWAVTLVTATFVFSGLSNDPHWLIGVGGSIPVIAFWAMDAKYLHLEKCYRKLYEAVIAGKPITPFDLNYRPYVGAVDSVWRTVWSWSIRGFYGPLLILVFIMVVMLS